MLHRTSTFSWVRQCSQSLWRTKLDGDQVHVSQILLHYYNPREHYCVLLTRVNYIKEERLLNHTEQVTYVLCGHHDLGSTHTLDLWMHSIDLSSDVCKKSWYSGWDGIGACSAGSKFHCSSFNTYIPMIYCRNAQNQESACCIRVASKNQQIRVIVKKICCPEFYGHCRCFLKV